MQQAQADQPVPAPGPGPSPAPVPSPSPSPERSRGGEAPGGVDTKDLIQMGKMALRFMNTPAGREIQRSIFGVLRKRR